MIQKGLDLAFFRLDERQAGTARREQAITMPRAELPVLTHDRVSALWAESQTNLGLALAVLDEWEDGHGVAQG